MLEHAQLEILLSGWGDPLWICSLPEKARQHMGCSSGAVYLSRKSAEHILSEHQDIDRFQILLLPIIICQGELRVEPGAPRFINAILSDRDGKHYFVTMKSAAKGHELWVQTMYRLTTRKLQKKLARSLPL